MSVETDLHQYVKLRTMLDSVVAGSLRYYLNVTSWDEQQTHYDFLYSHLETITKKVFPKPKNPPDPDVDENGCPDGYHFCDGCCVPYECVVTSSNQ